MKKQGDSCFSIKQLFTIGFIVIVFVCAGVNSIASDAEINNQVVETALSYESSGDKEMDESAQKIVNDFFNGSFIKEMLINSSIDDVKKELISSLFESKEEKEEIIEEAVEAEENIIVDVPIMEEEVIKVEDVVPLAPGQESVWLYEESQLPDNYITYYDMQATAYCLCKKCTGKTPGSSGYGRTSSGLVIVPGTSMKVCAVNKKQIPLGTHIYVQGLNGAKDYGYAIAADTGGAITTNRIDLYFDNHSTCLKWGRRSVRVYILPEE